MVKDANRFATCATCGPRKWIYIRKIRRADEETHRCKECSSMWPQWALKKAGVRQKEEGRSEDKKAAEEANRRKKDLEQAKKEGKDAAWVQTYISLFPMAAQKEQPGEAGTYRGVEEAAAKVRQMQAKLEATTETLSALQAKVEKKEAELKEQADELLQAREVLQIASSKMEKPETAPGQPPTTATVQTGGMAMEDFEVSEEEKKVMQEEDVAALTQLQSEAKAIAESYQKASAQALEQMRTGRAEMQKRMAAVRVSLKKRKSEENPEQLQQQEGGDPTENGGSETGSMASTSAAPSSGAEADPRARDKEKRAKEAERLRKKAVEEALERKKLRDKTSPADKGQQQEGKGADKK